MFLLKSAELSYYSSSFKVLADAIITVLNILQKRSSCIYKTDVWVSKRQAISALTPHTKGNKKKREPALMHRLGLFRGRHSYGCLQLAKGACSKGGISSFCEIAGFCLCPMHKGFLLE